MATSGEWHFLSQICSVDRGRALMAVVLTRPALRQAASPLSERLARLRESAGMSQRSLGRRIGRSHSVISRWESGSLEPTIFDLEALGRQLRVKVDDLLLDSDIVEVRRRWSSRSHSVRHRRALGAAISAARVDVGLT